MSMGATLTETPSSGGIDHDGATFGSQTRLPVGGYGQQSTHKTFNSKCVLPTRCAGTKLEQRRREWPTND